MIFVCEIAETVRVKSNFSQRSMKQQVTDHAMSSKKNNNNSKDLSLYEHCSTDMKNSFVLI